MPRSRQNARTSRSQPLRAKQRFCTKAGGAVARAHSSSSWSRPTLLTPRKRVLPAACSSSMACLVVVTALVRRVDAAEAGLEGQPRQALGVPFLPGRAVDEARHAPARDGKVARDLVRMVQGCLFLCRCVSIARAVRRVTVDR